jgi:haloalkane dehalogenase
MVDFAVDRRLYPFESRWYDGRYGKLHYIDEGAGPPLVFFHGNPTWSFLYRNVITALRDRFRCIAVDYLGFGLSERPPGFGYTLAEQADAVGELLDHLALDGFVTMGQDWGGPISMAAATVRADRVRGVVLGNTWFWPSDHWRLKLFSVLAGTPPMQQFILRANAFVESVPYATTAELDAQTMRHYRGVQPNPAARAGIAQLPKQIRTARPVLAALEHDVPRRLGSKPALFFWGMKDAIFPLRTTIARFQHAFPDNVVELLPQANHFFQEDAPDVIAAAITRRFAS